MEKSKSSTAPVAVIGGGIIGLSVAWQLLRRGYGVTVFERESAPHGASWASAGMLAPNSEVGFEEEPFLRVALASMKLYPRFLQELNADSGKKLAVESCGSLMVAFDRDDTERIRRLFDFRVELGLPVEWLNGREARAKEPLLSPKVTAAVWLPDDGQVNNRHVVDALRIAVVSRGGALRKGVTATAVRTSANHITHVRTSDGVAERASRVVVAAGCWSNRIEGVPEDMRPPVRPVKGQVVSLRMSEDFGFEHMVRAPDVYLLPKNDGRLVVGATQEEMGFDTSPTAGGVFKLLERAWEAMPSIYDLAIESIDVGLRPGSRDNEPIVGATPIDNLYYATGHFRHGILLAPVTAYELCDLIDGKEMSPYMTLTDPMRFARTGTENIAAEDQRKEPRA